MFRRVDALGSLVAVALTTACAGEAGSRAALEPLGAVPLDSLIQAVAPRGAAGVPLVWSGGANNTRSVHHHAYTGSLQLPSERHNQFGEQLCEALEQSLGLRRSIQGTGWEQGEGDVGEYHRVCSVHTVDGDRRGWVDIALLGTESSARLAVVAVVSEW